MTVNKIIGMSTVTLTYKESKLMLELLAPSAEVEDIVPYNLYKKIEQAEHAGREGAALLFVNTYRLSRQYGGPEEGGWYYTAYECEEWDPCHSVDDAINWLLHRAYERFSKAELKSFELVADDCPMWMRAWDADTEVMLGRWKESAKDEAERYLYLLADDTVIAIEQTPMEQQTNRRPIYE